MHQELTHNLEVVGSNPAPATCCKSLADLFLEILAFATRPCFLLGPKGYILLWHFEPQEIGTAIMPKLTFKVPAYRLHKASGQAICKIEG